MITIVDTDDDYYDDDDDHDDVDNDYTYPLSDMVRCNYPIYFMLYRYSNNGYFWISFRNITKFFGR